MNAMSEDKRSLEASTTTQLSSKWSIDPIILALGFFFLAFSFRLIDVFILNLDLTMFGIITSKVIPLTILLIYVRAAYQTYSPLGIHGKQFVMSCILGILVFGVYWVFPVLLGFVIELIFGFAPIIAIGNYPIFLITYWLVFFIVNSFMEEGIFRGLMMRCFMTQTTVFKANVIQSFLFGFWHLVWPVKNLISGVMDPTTTAWYAAFYLTSSTCFGFVTGYMLQKTSSLFAPIVLHTLWNFSLFILIFTNLVPLPIVVSLGISLITDVIGLTLALLVTWLVGMRLKKVELTPWNEPI